MLTEEDFALYHELLIDVGGAEVLDAACRKASQVCRFFPVPADILAQVEKQQAQATRNTAESEWLYIVERVNFGDKLKLSDAAQYAAKCAGGLMLIGDCPVADLVWRKRDFIEAYNRYRETEKAEIARKPLTEAESRNLLAQVAERARIAGQP